MIRSPPLGALKSEPPISGSILVLSQLSAAARSPLWPLWLSSGTIKEKSGRVWLARSAENCEKGTRLFACARSEEHTSELQSRLHLVCRLLLEKKKMQN